MKFCLTVVGQIDSVAAVSCIARSWCTGLDSDDVGLVQSICDASDEQGGDTYRSADVIKKPVEAYASDVQVERVFDHAECLQPDM